MGKNKLKIGEFSRLGRVTVRALRHYEEIDLLRLWTGIPGIAIIL